MKVEKKQTNKIGLIIFWILLIAGLAGGGYYLYTHKDSLNIDWDFTLPWKNNEEKEQGSDGGANNIKKREKNYSKDFVDPDSFNLGANRVNTLGMCRLLLGEIETNNSEIIINYTVDNQPEPGANEMSKYPCKLEITRIAVNFLPISTVFEQTLNGYNMIKKDKFVIKRSELEKYEMKGITNMTFFFTETDLRDNTIKRSENQRIDVITAKPFQNKSTGLTFDNIEGTEFQYFKTIVDQESTYIYFIVNNIEGSSTSTVKLKKLLINGKNYNVPDLEVEVLFGIKNIFYIEIPKSDFKKVNEFVASFFLIKDVDGQKAFYISNEYSRKV